MKRRKLIGRLFIIIFLSCMLLIIFCYTHPSISRPQNLYNRFADNLYDGNGILEGALKYIATKPKYKSRYYKTGYSDDKYGVCTDVIAMAMKSIGYDLMYLVNEDIKKNPIDYKITKPDINIDFRRVKNLKVYFDHTAVNLTNNIFNIADFEPGDIIIFSNHVGIVSDKRNKKGIPHIIHHSPWQLHYEENILERRKDLIGHYRIVFEKNKSFATEH